MCGQPENFVHISTAKYNPFLNFTVCLTTLHSNFSDAKRLVEFIEMHRILGAQRIVVYNENVSGEIHRYLEMYKSSKFVDVYQWKVPSDVDIHYHGQIAMVNDCLYRYMYISKYVSFVDVDEMIIPVHNYTWNDLILTLERKTSRIPKAGFIFKNVFYNLNFEMDEEAANNSLIKENRVLSLLYTKRENFIFEPYLRSKVIVNPRRVTVMDVHYIEEVLKGFSSYFVNTDMAVLQQYREFYNSRLYTREAKRKRYWLVNRIMFRYSKDLLNRILYIKNIMEPKEQT